MNLADELRGLETPEPEPDLSRAIMAQIERLDENRPRESVLAGWALPAAFVALAVGSVLIVFSGVIATALGPLGRSLVIAMPTVPGATLGPVALVAGVLVYVVGLSLAGSRNRRAVAGGL